MKKILFTLITVLIATLAAQADVTINSSNFPDANFRSYLLSKYPAGYITTAQINSLTSLDVSDKNISSLVGISYFTYLKILHCEGNNITSLNLSYNTRLESVYCRYNKLTYLNVNGLTSMTSLLAAKYGADEELAASGVFLSTLMSLATVPLVMGLLFT